MNIFKELKFFLIQTKFNFQAAAELRASFLIQVLGMTLNNLSLVAVWLIFFEAFGEINGWGQAEVIGLQGLSALAYGIAFTLGHGVQLVPSMVNNGTFDRFLTTPKSLYLKILSSSLGISAIGDILFGIVFVSLFVYLAEVSIVSGLVFFLLSIPAALIIANIYLITSLVSFLVPDAELMAKNFFELFFAPSLYPAGVFQGGLRFVFSIVLPSLFIGGLPVEYILDQNVLGLFGIFVISFIWMIITLFLLQKAIKKYESGNLTGARV